MIRRLVLIGPAGRSERNSSSSSSSRALLVGQVYMGRQITPDVWISSGRAFSPEEQLVFVAGPNGLNLLPILQLVELCAFSLHPLFLRHSQLGLKTRHTDPEQEATKRYLLFYGTKTISLGHQHIDAKMTVLNEVGKLGLPLMNLLRFKGMPILEQLRLEEKLLRLSSDNWCIVNDGTNAPAIVMGLSGKPSELLELGSVLQDQVPVIRRFTGGGTVIVDKGTIFVTLICNKDDVPGVQPYPRPIMSWSGLLYNEVFRGIGDFQLRENDYVFGDRKFGGNAQSITKSRWIHHTSFLWDYEVTNMAYLKLPAKAPNYRLERDHLEFICRMKEYLPRSMFIEKTLKALEADFSLQQVNLEAVVASHDDGSSFVHSTRLLRKQELEDALTSPVQRIAQSV